MSRFTTKKQDPNLGSKYAGEIAFFTGERNDPSKVLEDIISKNPNLFRGSSGLEDYGDCSLVEDSVNTFFDNAKLVTEGLQALAVIHPAIGAAVGAFNLVISMYLKRRDNNRKVVVINVRMQELMLAFFQLRDVHDPQEKRDGLSVGDRLKDLASKVAEDIKACASACDEYLKKGALVQTFKAIGYEAKFAKFVQTFLHHKSALQFALSLYTAAGVSAANAKLDDQGERLKNIEKMMETLFRRLDTPRERELQKFIEEHGGVNACISNDEYLGELVAKSGDSSLSRMSGRSGGSGRGSNDLVETRKRLLKEVQEDLDEAFKRNMVLFERKFNMQSKQLEETMRQESNHVISALTAGAHDRINDADLRELWKEMGWRGSVKARTFVLNLHDHYAGLRKQANSSINGKDTPTSPPSGARLPSPKKKSDDRWALAYISAAHVQSILEAIDDDGTGYISIQEVNTFVEERPSDWSLPEWFAYWAVGWQISITQYKSKIYGLVRSMFEMLDHILPSNRRGVDAYLFHSSFWRIELILRSTTSVNPKMLSDSELVRYTEMYTAEEEKRLEKHLEDVGYELDTTATVSLVTGEGRIERFVYPLIYLLLKRHLRVLTLACKHVLDAEEFILLNESLVSVLLAVDTRIQNIEAVFKQTTFDIQARLGNFAFGLLQLSYGDIRRVPAQITFGTWSDEEDVTPFPRQVITKESIQATLATTSHDILKYGHRDGYQSTNYFEFEPHRRKYLGPPHPLEGTWTGHNMFLEGEDTITYILRISILVQDGRQIVGKGEHFTGAFEFSGTVHQHPGRRSKYSFLFRLQDDKDGLQKECQGQLDAKTGVVLARWTDRRAKQDPGNITYQPFQLTRTPPSLTRHRYTSDALAEDPVRARWSFACAAAWHMAQEKMWSRAFLEERAAERKRYVELSVRSLIVTMRLTPQKPLNATEKGELDWLRRNLNPSEARFYQVLADFEIQKLPWHPTWGCDWCERRITKARHLCITCMSDDLSDNIDLCSVCVDRAPSKRGFAHDPSHTMVKVEQTLHDFHFLRVVENARTTVEKMKNMFKVMEANALHPDENGGPEGGNSHKVMCAFCAKIVTPTCWACLVCTRDTFVCNECNTNRVPLPLNKGPSPSHKMTHSLVRITGDMSASRQAATAGESLGALERRLALLEHQVTDGFTIMNAKLAMVEERFDIIETLLKQILLQNMALPAVHGQVVGLTMALPMVVREAMRQSTSSQFRPDRLRQDHQRPSE